MNHKKKSTFGFWATITVAGVLVALALYVLSAGPFAFFVAKEVVDANMFNRFYMPVSIAGHYLPEWTIYWFVDYCHWWATWGESARL